MLMPATGYCLFVDKPSAESLRTAQGLTCENCLRDTAYRYNVPALMVFFCL